MVASWGGNLTETDEECTLGVFRESTQKQPKWEVDAFRNDRFDDYLFTRSAEKPPSLFYKKS